MSDISASKQFDLYLRLLGYVKSYWLAFLIAMVANILYAGVNAGFTYLLKPILDKGFVHRDVHFIKFLPFIILGVFVIRGVTNFVSSYFMAYVSRSVIKQFREEIFAHLLKIPATFYDRTTSGKILSTILYNVEQVANAGSETLTTLVQSVCLVIGLLVVMFSISWRLSLLYLITVPLISLLVHFGSKRLRAITLKLQKKMGDITNIAEEAIEGYKVIRIFGGEVFEQSKFNLATQKNRCQELKIVMTKAAIVSTVQFIAAVALGLTIYFATNSQTTLLTAGAFASLITAMWSVLKPLKDFTKVNTKLQRGLAGAQTVFSLLDQEIEQDQGEILLNRIRGEVVYDKVSFQYPETHRQVLDQVNLKVAPGQIVALVGQSGGGKTTLVNLLQRFYIPTSGTIRLDGMDVQHINLESYRDQFAIVSQHVTLFDDTIRNNIAYGKQKETSENEIIEAAKAANAWEFIQEMPEGLDTLIGENGTLLSGGQRQRLAIARAILKKAAILILDEATSALDTESERKIQKALDNLMKNQTTFVIAHRLSTIEKADMILVVEHGKIVESGSHQSLLELNGYYAKLHKMQFHD